jgi:ATP-binding cassette subfamily B protein
VASVVAGSSGLVETCAWPIERLGEAIELLARQEGLLTHASEPLVPAPELAGYGEAALGQWIEAAADRLGVEAEPADLPYQRIEALLEQSVPAIMLLPGMPAGCPRVLAICRAPAGRVALLGPDLARRTWPLATLSALLREPLEQPFVDELERLLDQLGVAQSRRVGTRGLLLRERLRESSTARCWLIRHAPQAAFATTLARYGLVQRALAVLALHALQYGLWVGSWWLIGAAVLRGRLDAGLLWAWALLLLGMLPLRALKTWQQGVVAVGAGLLLRQRLLHGALRLAPESTRHQGMGRFLGQTLELEMIEQLALGLGLTGLVALIELVVGAAILGLGLGWWAPLVLLGWLASVGLLTWRFARRYQRWTQARFTLTNTLVEQMVGHRTLLAQDSPRRWHERLDRQVEPYVEQSVALDRAGGWLVALSARGWLALGLACLAPLLLADPLAPGSLALGLGAVLLIYEALRQVTASVWSLVAAAVAWREIAPLFQAGGTSTPAGLPTLAVAPVLATVAEDRPPAAPLLAAHDLRFGYEHRPEAVLQGCTLQIGAGERLLLEGRSGAGKSTLAALLAGLRRPTSGLLLLRGVDYQTLGAVGLRRRVAVAPQFHENHVLTESFAFNALMGRRWPPEHEDTEEAERVCRALGLGELLERMPGGLFQMVGETGWQLSHGERSRLFIARALLQGAELIILDESLAALDPQTLRICLTTLLDESPALLVVAHP